MTEAEWQSGTDPTPMLKSLRGRASDRKLRLFACACCRRVTHLPYRDVPPAVADHVRAGDLLAIQAAERFADGAAAKLEMLDTALALPVVAVGRFCSRASARDAAEGSAESAHWFVHWHPEATAAEKAGERAGQAGLLRDIFGSRLRPVTADPRWRTPTATGLAGAIYAERAFDRMPILADALADAGCDDADVLSHCRGDGPHVRGCWVVDLLLGKK